MSRDGPGKWGTADKDRASGHEGGEAGEEHSRQTRETQGAFEEWGEGKCSWNTEEGQEHGMSWVTGLMGLGVRGFYFILKEVGNYGKLPFRSDSFCFVSYLLTKLSCLKAVWFLSIPRSEGRHMAVSSGAPWLREDTWQPRLRNEGLAMPPAAPSPNREDKPCPPQP